MNIHIFQRPPNVAIAWDIVNRMTVVYPIIEGQLQTLEFQNVFRLNSLVFVGIVVWCNLRIETQYVVRRPQSTRVMNILKLHDEYVRTYGEWKVKLKRTDHSICEVLELFLNVQLLLRKMVYAD
jgi:hypothetical protein